MSEQTFSISTTKRAVFVKCDKPEYKKCYLTRSLSSLHNLRVWSEMKHDGHECSVVSRCTDEENKRDMPMVVDLVKQVCTMCQNNRQKLR